MNFILIRKILFVIISISLLQTVIAQQTVPQKATPKALNVERSMSNLPLISETRSFIDKASGWMLQDNGEWISSENLIPYKKAELNRSSKAYYKLGKENFQMLEIRDVMINNELYAIFIIRFRTGWYEFPILKDGWHKQVGLSYYVFKASKLAQVVPDKFEYNQPYIANLDVICNGTIVDYDLKTLNSTIAYQIQKTFNDKTIASINLLIAFMPVQINGENLARFRLIQVMNKKKLYLPYLDPKDRDKLFRSSYYELNFDVFRGFIRYNAGSIAVPQYSGTPKSPEEFYKRGISNYAMGNHREAVIDLTEASKSPPYSDFFLTYAYRANARQKMGELLPALQDFDRAVALKPNDQSYYSAWLTTIYNRGVARFNSKDNAGACQDWQTAVQLGFKDVSMDNMIRENCRNYKFTPNSLTINTLPSSTPNTPSTPPEIQNDYYKIYWEGIWKYENGNYSEALKNFNRALELKPQTNITSVYNYRGNCRLKMADYQGAIGDFDVAINYAVQTDNNTLKTIYYNRGLANYFLGISTLACSDFRKAVSMGLSEPEYLKFIGQVCK